VWGVGGGAWGWVVGGCPLEGTDGSCAPWGLQRRGEGSLPGAHLSPPLPPTMMSWKVAIPPGVYNSGLRNPTGFPIDGLKSAVKPAHNGATALVPPMTAPFPSTRTLYPVTGSASPATSGTPRPGWPLGLFGTFAF